MELNCSLKHRTGAELLKSLNTTAFFFPDSKVDQGHREKFAEARQILVNRGSEANCWTGFTYQSSTLNYTGDKSDVFAQYPKYIITLYMST